MHRHRATSFCLICLFSSQTVGCYPNQSLYIYTFLRTYDDNRIKMDIEQRNRCYLFLSFFFFPVYSEEKEKCWATFGEIRVWRRTNNILLIILRYSVRKKNDMLRFIFLKSTLKQIYCLTNNVMKEKQDNL